MGGLSLISQSGADGALIYKGKIFSKGFVACEFVPLRQHLEYYLSRLESLRHVQGAAFGGDAGNNSFWPVERGVAVADGEPKKRHKKRVLDDWRRCAEVAACGCEELEEIRETNGFSVRVPLPL